MQWMLPKLACIISSAAYHRTRCTIITIFSISSRTTLNYQGNGEWFDSLFLVSNKV